MVMLVDASPNSETIAERIHKKVSYTLFSYTCQAATANVPPATRRQTMVVVEDLHVAAEDTHVHTSFLGMEHLCKELSEASGIATKQQAMEFIRQHHLDAKNYPDVLERAQRVAIALQQNAKVINPEKPPEVRRKCLQLLLDHAQVLAVSLLDLKEPAKLEPMHIKVFGEPSRKNPIRLNPKAKEFVLKEVAAVQEAGLVCETGSDWASPTFAVPKPRSEKLRLVIDYRGLNA